MRACVFNAEPLVLGATVPPPGPADFPDLGFRGAPLATVRERTTEWVRRALDALPIVGDRRHVLVELRVSTIRPGHTAGMSTWHMDTVPDPWHPSPPERHHLLVTGTASLTEFLAGPLELRVAVDEPPYARMWDLDAQLRALAPPTVRVPSCRATTYGRLHLHRATPGTHEERRLLLRVTETDVGRPVRRAVPVG